MGRTKANKRKLPRASPNEEKKQDVWGDIVNLKKLHDTLDCDEYNRAHPEAKCEKFNFFQNVPADVQNLRQRTDDMFETEQFDFWDIVDVTEDCEKRRMKISQNVADLVKKLWLRVRSSPLRIGYSNVIISVTTLAELWRYANTVLVKEHDKLNCCFPPILLDRFERLYALIASCETIREVPDTSYQIFLMLRDKILFFVELVFRHNYGVVDEKLSKFADSQQNKVYNTYDRDWLTAISNGNANAQNWARVSRINQYYMCIDRLRIINAAAPNSEEIPVDDEGVDVFKIRRNEYKLLMLEKKIMGQFNKIYEIVRNKYPDSAEVKQVAYSHFFIEATLLVRKKRQNILVNMLHEGSSRDDLDTFQEVIAVMTILETNLLILSKVFLPVADRYLGIFSKTPKDAVDLILDVYFIGKPDDAKFPFVNTLLDKLELVRNSVYDNIKEFYTATEGRVEPMFVEPMPFGTIGLPFSENRVNTGDPNMDAAIIQNLKIEKYERKRLRTELKRAWMAKTIPPHENIPEYKMNKFTDKNVLVFRSTFCLMYLTYRSLQLEGDYAAYWACMAVSRPTYKSELVNFMKVHTRNFIYRAFPPMKKIVRDVIVLSFVAAIMQYFLQTESATWEVNRKKASCKINMLCHVLRPTFEYFWLNDKICCNDVDTAVNMIVRRYRNAVLETGLNRSYFSRLVTHVPLVPRGVLMTMARDFVNFVSTYNYIRNMQ